MDLGRSLFTDRPQGRSTGELLSDIAAGRRERQRLEIRELLDIAEWADAHTVTPRQAAEGGAATTWAGVLDTGVPIAGPGAPLVSEFGLMELVATLERSPESGREHVGKVLELCWRLPRLWAETLQGRCPVFKAMRVAELTRALSEQAAWFVDTQLAFAVGTCTWTQIERLVEEAITRYDPAEAERRRRQQADRRRFDVRLDEVREGLVPVDGVLDAGDAKDLEEAVARRARSLAALGSVESLDVRRSIAAGELARSDLALDLEVTDPDTGDVRTVPGRKVELHVHLSEAAITAGGVDPAGAVGRWGDARSPISAEQVRAWCGMPDTAVTVRPVIDLAGHVPVDSYEIADRLKAQVQLRDHHCAHPYCSRRAERCDIDHAQPYAEGGVTCPCQLVPACRSHHRAKTHSAWRYVIIEPGSYLWISPNGRHWLVDHRGTRALDPPRRLEPPTMDVAHDWETEGRTTQPVPPCPASANSGAGGRRARPGRPARRARTGDQLRLFADPPPV